MSKRDDIANKVKIECDPLFSFNFFIQRYLPSSILPSGIIYTLGDNNGQSIDEGTNQRTEQVKIVIQDTGYEDHENPIDGVTIEKKLNSYAESIESKFNKLRYNLGGIVYRFKYISTQKSYKNDGEKLIGIIVLQYEALWREALS